MILLWLILIPLIGGFVAWAAARGGTKSNAPRWISLLALAVDTGILLAAWFGGHSGAWHAEFTAGWIPRFGIGVHLAMDGLSFPLLLLTMVLGILSVAISWKEIDERIGFYHFNLMWTLAGVIGVFLALDLFLFYFFWELMLIPMYFLIGIWGHENRVKAAIKFFIFTQAGGLLMLVSIVTLGLLYHSHTGHWSFDYEDLLKTNPGATAAFWLLLGFCAAFAVKLPAVPIHTWLPAAHTEAPTAGSLILAGLLLKTGAYGFLRFAIPLFPGAAHHIAPVAMSLGVVGILYGALLAFAQTDFKRLVAYSSVSHLGFVLLAAFAMNRIAYQGAVMQMITHGLSTGALFILAGMIQERIHTRDLGRMGGLWSKAPRMGGMLLFFALASLGLPGLGNFVAEFLVLLGSFRADVTITIFATIGLVGGTIYSLRVFQRSFQGPPVQVSFPDLGLRETAVLAVLVVGLLWLGLYPQPVLHAVSGALDTLKTHIPELASR